MIPSFQRSVALVLALSCGVGAIDAFARNVPPYEMPPARVAVHTGDLDLSSERDNTILKRRIRRAASRVCTPPGGDHLWGRYGNCYRRALEAAESQAKSLPRQRFVGPRQREDIAGTLVCAQK